ncbi:hypothetical protein Ahy_B10g105842 isoform E [Arachis hypogaea]|uniref:Cullin N-terminal domain-containing protein n=1 Tax=Arachis hypogaea TaxID=3818 RepID=A0A444X9C3_ARAHY|nr:hypothetical protein Ahy_B10g105842 isoform E [Arachis hypogaea]
MEIVYIDVIVCPSLNFHLGTMLPPLLSTMGDEDKEDVESLISELVKGVNDSQAAIRRSSAYLIGYLFKNNKIGQMDHYRNDFEAAMLKDTSAYYSRKASNWILENSCPDYMLKAEECLKREKDRVAYYLHSSSEPKLF